MARFTLNRKSELPETCGGCLLNIQYLEPIQPRELTPHSFSCSFINQRRSLPISFSSCSILQTCHNRHHGHILDFLPLPADRSTSSRLEPAASPDPKQDRSIALSWLRGIIISQTSNPFPRSHFQCSSHEQLVLSSLVLQVCHNSEDCLLVLINRCVIRD